MTRAAVAVLLACLGCASTRFHRPEYADRETCALDGMVLVGKNYTSERSSSSEVAVSGRHVSRSSGRGASEGLGLVCHVPTTEREIAELASYQHDVRARKAFAAAANKCEREQPREVCGTWSWIAADESRAQCVEECARAKMIADGWNVQ